MSIIGGEGRVVLLKDLLSCYFSLKHITGPPIPKAIQNFANSTVLLSRGVDKILNHLRSFSKQTFIYRHFYDLCIHRRV